MEVDFIVLFVVVFHGTVGVYDVCWFVGFKYHILSYFIQLEEGKFATEKSLIAL